MTVIFDNSVFFSQKAGGVSIVWYEFLKRILLNNNIISYFVEYKTINNLYRKNLEIQENSIITQKDIFSRIQRYFSPAIKFRDKFIFHSPYYRISTNKRAINIITLHDFIYEYFAHGFRKKFHCWQKYHAIKQSDIIICISENTKKDLLKFVPNVDKNKIRVVYNGVSESYYPINKDFQYIPYSNESYVLYVGSRSSYKMFDIAVKAVAASKLNLIIVGSTLSPKEKKNLNEILGKERYQHLGFMANEKLNELYNNSYAFLYPSAYEGFGIPVLEAQKAGCPVIAYNASSIPEIIGDTPLLMDELSVETILNCFTLLKDSNIRKKIIEKGLKNVNRFSWDNMYKQIIKIYNETWDANRL